MFQNFGIIILLQQNREVGSLDFHGTHFSMILYQGRFLTFTSEKSKQIERLQISYETEKKEAEIVLQLEEIKTLNEKAKVDKFSHFTTGKCSVMRGTLEFPTMDGVLAGGRALITGRCTVVATLGHRSIYFSVPTHVPW